MDNTKENRYSDFFCPVPFEFVYIDYNGNMNPHCEGLVTCSMGSLKAGSFFDVWNSDIAQKIRESILDGSFQFCDEQRCWALRERVLPNVEKINNQAHRDVIKNKLTVLKSGPKAVNFGYDRSCNMNCQSCRKEYSVSHDDRKAAETIHQKAVGKYLKDTKRLILSGMGDPFASRLYRKFLQDFNANEFPHLKLQIVTNGLLLTPDMWKTLSNCYGAIDKISISIDAATGKTYQMNRGGDFKALIKNLEFISRIRQKNLIKDLCIDFVVQANNYKEMKPFVEIGKEYKCDYVAFKHIDNWGTYTENEFKQIAVHDPSHPEHNDFLEILSDPVMKDPIVWMRNLIPLLPIDYEKDGYLSLCDYEVYNMLLNDIEWDFFQSKLSLTNLQSIKISTILNNMKENITKIYSHSISEGKVSPLEYISDYAGTALEMDEGSLSEHCKEYVLREAVHISEPAYAGVEKLISEGEDEIIHLLSSVQQSTFRQLVRIKPLTAISTGYAPLRERFVLMSGKRANSLN